MQTHDVATWRGKPAATMDAVFELPLSAHPRLIVSHDKKDYNPQQLEFAIYHSSHREAYLTSARAPKLGLQNQTANRNGKTENPEKRFVEIEEGEQRNIFESRICAERQ
jgi:hypothetical protein